MPFVQRVIQPTYLSRSHGNRISDNRARTTGAVVVARQKHTPTPNSATTAKTTTRVLVHSNAAATAAVASVEPSVSSIVATPYKQEEDTSSSSHSPPSSTSDCCCVVGPTKQQHCCNEAVGINNNNTTKSKGIIGSCCNGKTNSLSSFSYSTADIDIEVVDDEVDSSAPLPPTSGHRHPSRCRGEVVSMEERFKNGSREEAEVQNEDESKEFHTSNNKRSGYGGIDCYSGCNGGSNSLQQAAAKVHIDDENDDDEDSTDDVDEICDAAATIHQPEPPPIVTGYELESISNITLSNALRQLASLVIIASDIFHNLNKELQNVGDRTRGIKAKIDLLDRKVSSFDPKLVTVPESDLGTFAQRKTHYQCDKSFHKELFTSETRPTSVQVLYEEAAKISECRLQAFRNDTTTAAVDNSCTGAVDELVFMPVFGKANRKMRTRIDAEIEIRLPAGIEDLRKWTSSEALGDVTVTPDCLNRVDASISTSIIIGDNGVLTPALSPSVLSADAVDAIYSINNSNDNLHIPNDINKDVPLNHRLPSPEEQCKLLALRYPAEVISVDTSGKRFERMCLARKSTTGCALGMSDSNNLNEDVHTVSRRSRSRKVRGKRRNTIAGIDQKEIQDAANGADTHDSGKNSLAATTTAGDTVNPNDGYTVAANEEKNKFGRSKSSDILKKESVALPYDKGKSTLTRLNSLKQWGRNRFKFITPSGGKSGHNSSNNNNNSSSSSSNNSKSSPPKSGVTTQSTDIDIDDECIVHELTSKKNELFEKEGRFSHERKPSYSSSEKSVSLASNGGKSSLGVVQKLAALGSGNVKLRDTSSLNRQRRNGINGHNKDEPHSSSGNWSASSESGRTSIGSEITIQPKSSASNTSLNVSSFHPGSGPPSSIISRRRFLNTSASSSVTSEGTATPDLQVNDDDETSSAYSCDTEGYYTSFHMDSGLRTLKEEEPMSPLQTSSTHPSNYSFGSVSNQTVLTAENEYELFGRGSTSTTTSSAGTVCTTLLVSDHGPDVPERISSLSKLNNSASTSTLERSYSSSTVGSTLERTGTIKRNVLATNTTTLPKDAEGKSISTTDSSPASQESEFTFETRIAERSAQPLPSSEVEYSESSDLEGVERIERIKQKTAMTAKRIPSMCIITPSTSDDENIKETITVNYATPYATVDMLDPAKKDYNLNHLKRTLQHPLHNMLDKLKVVLPNKRKSPAKQDDTTIYDAAGEYVTIADISNNNNNKKTGGSLGIYYSNDIVRRNLNPTLSSSSSGNQIETVSSGSEKKEYVSLNELPCNIRRNQAKGNIVAHPFALPAIDRAQKINSKSCAASGNVDNNQVLLASSPYGREDDEITTTAPSPSSLNVAANKGARVKMNSQGKAIYDSDSLKRRKGAHTTFAPGPYVKETESALLFNDQITNSDAPPSESSVALKNKSVISLINGGCVNRKVPNVRPVVVSSSSLQHRPPLIVNMTTKCLERPPPPLPQTMPTMMAAMPSPSSSSTSSTLTSSSTSSSSSTASNNTVLDEGYHRFSKIGTNLTTEKSTPTASIPMDSSSAFNRNTPVYWTLQNRRQTKPSSTPAGTCRDDLYAVPISRANRNALTKSNAELQRSTNISPIVPRTRSNFFTSTPTKSYQSPDSVPIAENTPSMQPSARSFQKGDENNPERLNTCSDRIGNSKTTLMDFKKLLLAKSVKNTPVKKLSAVELLKMNKREAEKAEAAANKNNNKTSAAQSLNSTMTLLDLSGSPKTFANRRMLRQGQFGSPSKSFAPKQRSAQWRMNSMRTDVISTTIPEANSEEDHSNSSGGSNHSGSKPSSEAGDATFERNDLVSEEKLDLKKNIFLQTEENNFMKGELKIPFAKINPQVVGKYVKNVPPLVNNQPLGVSSSNNSSPLLNNTAPAVIAAIPTANRNYDANELIFKTNNASVSQNIKIIAANMNKEATISPALETAL